MQQEEEDYKSGGAAAAAAAGLHRGTWKPVAKNKMITSLFIRLMLSF